jgi:GTP cyclohydrolase I
MKNGLDIIDEVGDNHMMTSGDTPLRSDAFELSDEEKIAEIKLAQLSI